MPEILLILEDAAQEAFLRPLVERLSGEAGIPLSMRVRSSQGGYGKALSALRAYVQAVKNAKENLVDGILVAVDANCHGYVERRNEIDSAAGGHKHFVIHAIPDPHIERWLLLDSEAFKEILNKGCSAPDEKCMKDRYKHLLAKAVLEAGVQPLLGGVEYAEDLATKYHFQRIADQDPSFGQFLHEMRNWFNQQRHK